jgi:hypothetical protein
MVPIGSWMRTSMVGVREVDCAREEILESMRAAPVALLV